MGHLASDFRLAICSRLNRRRAGVGALGVLIIAILYQALAGHANFCICRRDFDTGRCAVRLDACFARHADQPGRRASGRSAARADNTGDPKSPAQRVGCFAGDAIYGAAFRGGTIHPQPPGTSECGPWLSPRACVGVLRGPNTGRIPRITSYWSLQEFAATRSRGTWSYGGERISRRISDPRDLG